MEQLRVAIICDSIDDTLGGSYISAQRFARGLSDEGHHIVWCTSHFRDKSKREDFAYAKVYEFRNLFPIGPQHVRFAFPRVSSLVKIFTEEKIDIVYNIHPAWIGRQAYRAAKKLYIPMVSHSHVYPQLLLPGFPKWIQKIIKNIFARFYKKCDGMIYPTVHAEKYFDEYHFKNKQLVVSNGVDLNTFKAGEKKSDSDVFSIVFVGRLDPEKNISFLLDALHLLKIQNKLNHIQCTIVGSGSLDKQLHNIVHTYGLGHIVHFVGKLYGTALISSYQDASVYVLPSLFELESMTTLEAMACGCPILIANSPNSAARFFVDKNGYVFDPKDPQDLANKLLEMSSNHLALQKMTEMSIKNAKAFSFSESVHTLSDFFISLCK